MGNDASLPLKLKNKNKEGTLIEHSNLKTTETKKKLRSTSKGRGRKASKEDTSGQTTPSSSEGLQLPHHPGVERKRSKSLCAAQIEKEGPNGLVAQKSEDKERDLKARKSSSGLVPSFNRLRIQQCYKLAKPTMGEAILKRAAGARPELRAVFSRLKEEDYENMANTMFILLSEAVSHLDAADEVLVKARSYGELYAALCPLGFRPDLFSALADAAIAECVKLDAGLHKRCETLQAWSQLIGALFSAVRDGYYQRVRFQRRSSLPQHVVTKQLSIDASRIQPTLVE